MPSTIGTATIGTNQVAATSVTGWAADTPCGRGILVVLPSANTGNVYYRFVTGGNNVTAAVYIPKGVPFTINPAGMNNSLANLFFVADLAGQLLTAEAVG